MQILLHSIDRTAPQPVQEGASIGYWCEFQAPIASGKALFVPRGQALESDTGSPMEVRLGYESVSELQPLSPGEPQVFQFVPLQAPGDYRAKGRTVSLVWLDDEQQDAILEVLVGEDIFSISADILGEAPVEFGEWVSFSIHRLILIEREAHTQSTPARD